ncbi:MAG: UDP-N-acetylglucosamine 2-epimerase (non-hydrolyzing) [bacterium]|nr:UDP-N-acetylglucosamine 2-epimerase (non-hydrolyzing) [bacterium]
MFVLGTRPEAIKLAPVIAAFRERPELARARVLCTGQHREMLDQTLTALDLCPDANLDVMRADQQLGELTGALLLGVGAELRRERPDLVIVQGDTSTAFVAALAAFYERIPVAHVEAGLRTFDKTQPYPEESNRQMISALARYHFAPTERARRNLRAEGIADDAIRVTGNTVIDALLGTAARIESDAALRKRMAEVHPYADGRRMILITGHRRENFGPGLQAICEGIGALSRAYADSVLVYPVHLNPNVREKVHESLGGLANVQLIDPVDYFEMVWLLSRCHFVITDSGGIQEEAPSLGKPVLVTRRTTERPEAIEVGAAHLVGTDPTQLERFGRILMNDPDAYEAMSRVRNPFGDGRASERIADVVIEYLAG